MISEEKYQRTFNLIFNFSMIMGGMMMSTISQAFGAMTEVMTTGVLTVTAADKIAALDENKVKTQVKKEGDISMQGMIDDVVKQTQAVRPQLEANKDKIKKALTDKFCDQGLKINAKYKFKLDQQLSGEETAHYLTLALQKDPKFTQMFQELTAWMEQAPEELKSAMGQN